MNKGGKKLAVIFAGKTPMISDINPIPNNDQNRAIFLPKVSPRYPKNKAPIGLASIPIGIMTYVKRRAVIGSFVGNITGARNVDKKPNNAVS
jgi:hypothetical protein